MKRRLKEKLPLIVFFAVLYTVTGGLFYLAETRTYHPVEGYDPIRKTMLALLAPLLIKYTFQLGCTPLYSLVRRFRERKSPGQPLSVSVLIPAWNEEVGIIKTVRSVLDTNYPELQVVVINDGSTDATHEIMTRFLEDHEKDAETSVSIKYLSLPNGGKAMAMNRGLMHATGDIVITVDADSVMAPDAIENMVKCFSDPQVGGVAGNVLVANRKKPIEWMQQMEYVYGFFFKRADSLFNSVYIIGGAAAAYRRHVLKEMGGFDHAIITEDIEMSTRILKHGYKTRYASDAVVYTEGPSEIKGLCNQRLRWKHGRILTFIKHRGLFFSLRPNHNPYLSWFLLPIAVYAELLLLAEALLMSVFIVYTATTSDYMPLLFVVVLLSAVIGVQVLVDPRRRFHRNLVFLMPVAWLVFYAMDMIELQALIRSIRRLVMRRELKWQKWVRVGVVNDVCSNPSPQFIGRT
jgi:cellulose synthase/poly-beta-1,6-N-acetylglucosamine synthase-like glycosyltransferase